MASVTISGRNVGTAVRKGIYVTRKRFRRKATTREARKIQVGGQRANYQGRGCAKDVQADLAAPKADQDQLKRLCAEAQELQERLSREMAESARREQTADSADPRRGDSSR